METQTLQRISDKFYYAEGKLLYRGARCNPKDKESGWISENGYRMVFMDRKQMSAHRIIFALHHGYFPALVDHIDRNKLNNKIENLREATKSINGLNCNVRTNNTSTFTGVNYRKDRKKWRAYVKIDGTQHFIGYWDTIEKAVEARENYLRRKYDN